MDKKTKEKMIRALQSTGEFSPTYIGSPTYLDKTLNNIVGGFVAVLVGMEILNVTRKALGKS